MSGASGVDRVAALGRAVRPVAVTERSGLVESMHHGAVVALGSDGAVVWSTGDPDVVVYPRSAKKPLQADAMLALGLDLPPDQLALACASHDGSPRHVDVVGRILAGADLDEGVLANTPDLPLDRGRADEVVASGGHRAPIYMNCSGKHAAMLATCRINGWPIEGYLDADHPLQRAITDHIEALAGPIAHLGVDGCGAPAHAFGLGGLGRALATLATAQGSVWRAMTLHPDLVGGPGRDATRLMRAVPGLMAKDGAEGVFVAAMPDGRAVSVKIADGAGRAAGVVLAAALRLLDVDVPDDAAGAPILGHDRPVGAVRAILEV